MRQLLSLILVMSSFSVAYGRNPFENLVGCYNTVKWNGNTVTNNGNLTLSEIKVGDSMVALDLDQSELPAIEMYLFQEDIGDTLNYGYAFPLLNKGNYSESNGTFIFEFSGQVRYRFQPEYIGTLTHKVEYKKLPNGNVWLHNVIDVKETTAFNTDETYELEPTSCD